MEMLWNFYGSVCDCAVCLQSHNVETKKIKMTMLFLRKSLSPPRAQSLVAE